MLLAESAARELGRPLSLSEAFSLLLLNRDDPERYDRGAAQPGRATVESSRPLVQRGLRGLAEGQAQEPLPWPSTLSPAFRRLAQLDEANATAAGIDAHLASAGRDQSDG